MTTLVGLPLLVLLHELGHALAVRARGLPVTSIVVGPRGGAVRFDPERATPADVIVIALAGPLTSLALGPLLAALAPAGGLLHTELWLLALMSVAIGMTNLVPRGRPGTTDRLNDGRVAELAWRMRHP